MGGRSVGRSKLLAEADPDFVGGAEFDYRSGKFTAGLTTKTPRLLDTFLSERCFRA
jgi:hypothetical protein